MQDTATQIEHTTGWFVSNDGLRLYEQAWLPEGAPLAGTAIVHGYAEHSSRYDHVGRWFAERGYAVSAFDLRGHGYSDGERVLVSSFREHLEDVDVFLDVARRRSPAAPLFLLGHSMGGAIVALCEVMRHPQVDGIILSGPAIAGRSGGGAIVAGVLAAIGRIFPKLPLISLDAAAVSRDPDVVARYDADPLVYRGRMPAGTLAAAIRAVRAIDHNAERAAAPLLVMHGSEDQLADPEGSRQLYARAGSPDKTLKIYDGLYHEILNEPEQQEVMSDIAAWLEERITQRSAL